MKNRKLIILLITACIFLVLLGGYFLIDSAITWHKFKEPKWQDFGSYLGGLVSNIFALAGTSILIVAFLLQKNQLEVQQEELRLNTTELKLTREESEKQSAIWESQKFDANFMSLITNIPHIISTLRVGNIEGRGVLNYYYGILDRSGSTREIDEKVGVIFFNIFSIVKYVHTSPLQIDKKFYVKLALCQLSEPELAILSQLISDSSYQPPYCREFRQILIDYFEYRGQRITYADLT